MHAGEQLAGAAGSHEVGEAVVGIGELLKGAGHDEDDGERIEAFGFVDGAMA